MNRLNIELEDLNYDMEEEFKTLRTNLMFCGVDKKVILINVTEVRIEWILTKRIWGYLSCYRKKGD